MKNFKRIIAVIISVIIAFGAAFSASASQSNDGGMMSISDYKEKLWEEGIPVITTDGLLNILNTVSSVTSFLRGEGYHPGARLDMKVDDFVTERCNAVYKSGGLDIVGLLKSVPDMKALSLVVDTFNIDTSELREKIFVVRDKYKAEGNETMVKVMFMIGSFVSVVEECVVFAEPTGEDPTNYEVMLRLTYKDGTGDIMHPGIYINSETGRCTNKDGTGLIGTGFEVNLSEMVVYATINSWMRDFGFCMLYDAAALSMPLLWRYETRRFKFDYDGREWMIQAWKGNYLITNGAEVGVYNRNPLRFGSYYDCASDEQLMEMSMQLYHGDDLLVDQKPQMHWWINGFNMCGRHYIPESLTLRFSVEMPDAEMVEAFTKSIDRHYMRDVTYTVDGTTVYVVW